MLWRGSPELFLGLGGGSWACRLGLGGGPWRMMGRWELGGVPWGAGDGRGAGPWRKIGARGGLLSFPKIVGLHGARCERTNKRRAREGNGTDQDALETLAATLRPLEGSAASLKGLVEVAENPGSLGDTSAGSEASEGLALD